MLSAVDDRPDPCPEELVAEAVGVAYADPFRGPFFLSSPKR